MITTPTEYMKFLYLIQDQNKPVKAIILPTEEQTFDIDLNTRTINAPNILSVEKDHQAETVYFKCARYFDNMDLSNTICVVHYENKNAKDENGQPDGGHIYPVPFIDNISLEDEILFPWVIEGHATAAAGPVEFSVQFYLLNEAGDEFIYSLNTQIAKSKVLHGMNVLEANNENIIIPESDYLKLWERINEVSATTDLKWIEV